MILFACNSIFDNVLSLPLNNSPDKHFSNSVFPILSLIKCYLPIWIFIRIEAKFYLRFCNLFLCEFRKFIKTEKIAFSCFFILSEDSAHNVAKDEYLTYVICI